MDATASRKLAKRRFEELIGIRERREAYSTGPMVRTAPMGSGPGTGPEARTVPTITIPWATPAPPPEAGLLAVPAAPPQPPVTLTLSVGAARRAAQARVVDTLRPHQRERLEFIERRSAPDAPLFRGGILADEMGLGKTLPIVAYVWRVLHEGGRVLLVLSNAARPVFTQEFARIARALNQTQVPTPEVFKSTDMPRGRLVTVTPTLLGQAYEMSAEYGGAGARRSATQRHGTVHVAHHEMFMQKWNLVVIDEAHSLRTGVTELHRAVRALDADVRWAMTATAAQMDPDADLAGILSALVGHAVRPHEARAMYAAVSIRARIDDVGAPLPPRTDKLVGVDVAAVVAAMPPRLQATVQRMWLASPRAAVPDDPAAAALPEPKAAAAARAVVRGTVVFSQWARVLERVRALLARDRPELSVEVLDGARRTPELLERAIAGAMDVLLCTLGTGRESLNLVRFHRVVFVEPVPNPADAAQAAARVHRTGQTRPVLIVTLVARHRLDLCMLHANRERGHAADAANDAARGAPSV